MSEMRVFSNNHLGLQVRTMLNEDGSVSVNAEDTAIGFGWTQKQQKSGKEYISIRWVTLNTYLKEIGFPQEVGENDYIPESMFYLLGMKASNSIALEFQKWLALDVLPSLRKTGIYELGTVTARNDIGEIANLLREWRMWAQEQKMPYNQAMASLVNFLHKIGVPFPEEMIYLPPMDMYPVQLSINYSSKLNR